MTTITIPDNWQPTAANINALPDPLRDYVHHIETMADPQLLVQQNWELRDLVAALEAMVKRLKRERRRTLGQPWRNRWRGRVAG